MKLNRAVFLGFVLASLGCSKTSTSADDGGAVAAKDSLPADTAKPVEGSEPTTGTLSGDIAALITQKFKAEGIKNTTCPPTVTPAMTTFTCTVTVTNFDPITDAGTDRQLGVLVERDDKSEYNFMIESGNIAGPKAAQIIPKQMGPFAVTSADCGPTTLWLDAGASFECAAVDGKTQKNIKITVTTPTTGDQLHFHAELR